ncbi:YihY/virulence factor BrkB family protein [Occultella glacieicola]|uniref:YihY/virulence factor BrkB family protein n=1 Tax=Occultella glacieicola TaxID=2518684 RepID=A0ABY2E0U8_9MICO|nr:YihY/virulence factor BrkB family protein [Occultella glacieicola]TDE91551.1 YihY/virulence factor BrkB family protein [Occultella glacieicola]
MPKTTRPSADHPVKPDNPTDLRKPSWFYILRRTVAEFLDDQCTDLAAALTYYAVLSIFPAIIALVSILSLVGQASTTERLLGIASDAVPEDAMATLGPIIESLTTAPAPGLGLIVGLLTAVWTASNYVNAFSRAMNRMYEVPEGRPIWKLRPAMYALTVVMLLLVAAAGLILVVSGPVARAIGDTIGLGDTAVTVWDIAKWPVLLLIVILAIALLYYVTPNVKQPRFRWISMGAVIAIVLAGIASFGLGLYVSNFSSYDATYGALAGVIIFLLWLWVMNLALLFGAEFDAEMERGRELQAGIEAEETVQLPPRDTRASDKRAAKEKDAVARGRALRRSRGREADTDEQT